MDVEVFDSAEEWRKTQEPMEVEGQPLYMGPEFVTSPWLFALYGGSATAEEVSPVSMFKTVCKDVEVVTNQLSGIDFYRVRADCGFDVNLVLPIDIKPAPRPGSVVDGRAFMTGTSGYWETVQRAR